MTARSKVSREDDSYMRLCTYAQTHFQRR